MWMHECPVTLRARQVCRSKAAAFLSGEGGVSDRDAVVCMDPPRERGESEILWIVPSVRGIDETTGNQSLSQNYTAPFS